MRPLPAFAPCAFAFAALLLAPAARPSPARPSPAWAAPAGLEASHGWSRPAVAGTNGVGYLTIANHGARPDALVRVETPAAAEVDMHSMSMSGGMMAMASLARVAIPPGGQAAFAPGGSHLMLMGLTRTLRPGDQVPVTLIFASGARLKTALTVSVNPPGS
jgi:copper(I)-binding protein